MKRVGSLVLGLGLLVWAGAAYAHSEHGHEAAEPHEHGAGAAEPAAEQSAHDQMLTGEVVDVFCYLSHGEEGLGKGHAGCANKCIQSGLPVALKVGDQLYLATMASHDPANKSLAKFAGTQVTVRGKVMERDGQHLIAITHIEEQ